MLLSKNVHVFSVIPFKQNTRLVFCLMPSSKSNKNVHVLSVIQDSFCLTIRRDFSFQPWASANIWKGCVISTKLHGAEHMQTPPKSWSIGSLQLNSFLCSFALGGLWPYKCFILKEQNFRNIYVYIPNIILKLFETVVWKAHQQSQRPQRATPGAIGLEKPWAWSGRRCWPYIWEVNVSALHFFVCWFGCENVGPIPPA